MPTEPPPSPWVFPDLDALRHAPGAPGGLDGSGDLVAEGADLGPGTLLAAYRTGLFPMGTGRSWAGRSRRDEMGWWCPEQRGVLPLTGLRVSRSLRASVRRLEVRVDTRFDAVVAACADPSRSGAWIDGEIAAAYSRLHALGWAHSVETWADGELVGGLYGVAIGGLFAGESMFSHTTDASKVALVALVDLLREGAGDPGARLLDTQWQTPHLASLGVVEVPRATYLHRLEDALALPLPPRFGG